jgi:D-alanyl-D-alanine carboxypeptidase (penicillin-binding protein 5/6)
MRTEHQQSNLDLPLNQTMHQKTPRRVYPVVVFCVAACSLVAIAASSAIHGFNAARYQKKSEQPAEVLGAYSDASSPSSSQTANPESATAPTLSAAPTLNPLIAAPQVTAQSALVFQLGGPVLYSINPDAQVSIASLTKLMTALIVMQDPRHTQPITITAADHVDTNPVLHLKTGDSVYPDDLVHAMLVGSANDAALTLANHFGLPNQTFIQRMNAEATSLGMTNTMFSTPIGFDTPDNYSTARDLRKLINIALTALPFSETDQADSYTFHSANPTGGTYTIQATSHLPDTDASVRVLKTGFTDDAKQAMVAESDIQGRTVISVVLQSDNRDADSATLLHYVAQAYVWPSK